ncbi:MAG: hypothetical protein NTV34_00940 [Proteobacteria bacterium]|nr:hypothetical protein [Pseudomonadota bacterium]
MKFLALLFLFLSLPVYAGSNAIGNGGELISIRFVNIGKAVLDVHSASWELVLLYDSLG